MTEVGVHEAKTNLSRLLRRVRAGEEITITRGGEPVARLVPVGSDHPREIGVDDGVLHVPEDFDAPLPDEVLAAFHR
jgi:prevent-host-death family protein